MKTIETLAEVILSGNVERYHIMSGVSKQLVSSHSWGVAVICQYLHPQCSKELLLAAMYHDCAEIRTGDIPAPVKWDHPEIKNILLDLEAKAEKELGIETYLTPNEKAVLKLSDLLESMMYCNHRAFNGEKSANECILNCWEFINTKGGEILNKLTEEQQKRSSHLFNSIVGGLID